MLCFNLNDNNKQSILLTHHKQAKMLLAMQRQAVGYSSKYVEDIDGDHSSHVNSPKAGATKD